jgi:hypothetical protein
MPPRARAVLLASLCSTVGAQKLDVLWLVAARTGAVEVRKLRHADHDWLSSFRQHLVWERDAKGSFQLVAPRPDAP